MNPEYDAKSLQPITGCLIFQHISTGFQFIFDLTFSFPKSFLCILILRVFLQYFFIFGRLGLVLVYQKQDSLGSLNYTLWIFSDGLSHFINRMSEQIFPYILPSVSPYHNAMSFIGISIDIEISD
jgi:hypothetical protein